jgi:predicted RNA-binding protein
MLLKGGKMKEKIWLALTSLDNWDLIKNNNVYAVKNKKSSNKLDKNDILIFYVIPKRIGGFYKIIEKTDKEIIEFKGDKYKYQFKLTPLNILSSLVPINKKNNDYRILETLSIFKNKIHWGTVLMGRDIIQLTKEDYEYLLKVLKDV